MDADVHDFAADREQFLIALGAALSGLGIALTPEQFEQMFRHYTLLIEANRQFNLTRITSPAEAAVRHNADSLAVLTLPEMDVTQPRRVLDIGTGGGFPAIPIAIAAPEWAVLAIDGTGKKARFVADCAAKLGLSNLLAQHARAEDLVREQNVAGGKRERFDLILIRAVAELREIVPLAAPLVAPGGRVVCYKSAQLTPQEINAGNVAARKTRLRDAVISNVIIAAPTESLERRLVIYHAP